MQRTFPFRPSLALARWQLLPFVWQVGGALVSIAGFVTGANTLSDVGFHLSVLSFLTAVYLSLFIADRRRPQDMLAVFGYLLYAFGFLLLTAPPTFAPLFGLLPYGGRAVAAVAFALLLPVTWLLFTGYMFEFDPGTGRNNGPNNP